MIRMVLRSDYDEAHPPSKSFTVISAKEGSVSFAGRDTIEVRIEVSVEQLQAILRGCWKLLPPEERPCP
jgi:hypothetical protein